MAAERIGENAHSNLKLSCHSAANRNREFVSVKKLSTQLIIRKGLFLLRRLRRRRSRETLSKAPATSMLSEEATLSLP